MNQNSPRASGVPAQVGREYEKTSVKKHRPIERVPLHGLEAGVADDAAQLFLRRAVRCTGGLHHILFEHHRAYVVAAEVEA